VVAAGFGIDLQPYAGVAHEDLAHMNPDLDLEAFALFLPGALRRLLDGHGGVGGASGRILHQLFQLTEGEGPMTIEAQHAPDTPGGLTPEEERRVAVDLFNQVWELLETPSRSPAQEDRMVHAAHASRYHWGEVGEPANRARGEWLLFLGARDQEAGTTHRARADEADVSRCRASA
jgi:hypothetical protein